MAPLVHLSIILLFIVALARAQCYYNLTEDYTSQHSNPKPGGSPACPLTANIWTFEQVSASGVVTALVDFNPTYGGNVNFSAWQGTEYLQTNEYMPSFAKNFGSITIIWSGDKYASKKIGEALSA